MRAVPPATAVPRAAPSAGAPDPGPPAVPATAAARPSRPAAQALVGPTPKSRKTGRLGGPGPRLGHGGPRSCGGLDSDAALRRARQQVRQGTLRAPPERGPGARRAAVHGGPATSGPSAHGSASAAAHEGPAVAFSSDYWTYPVAPPEEAPSSGVREASCDRTVQHAIPEYFDEYPSALPAIETSELHALVDLPSAALPPDVCLQPLRPVDCQRALRRPAPPGCRRGT